MHPLHDYIVTQLAERLRAKRVVVWYDTRMAFTPFIAELRSTARIDGATVLVTIGTRAVRLLEYTGSMFEVRIAVEPYISGDEPDYVLIYVRGIDRDLHGSVLMELELGGSSYDPELKTQARNVLRKRYTEGVVDDLLKPAHVTYEDLARACSDEYASEPPSILKSIFHATSGKDALLCAWLSSDEHDDEIEKKEATLELTKLISSKLGLTLPESSPLSKLRSNTLRYVLAGEFRSDLNGPAPATLDQVPVARNKEDVLAIKSLLCYLRTNYADVYTLLADKVEAGLGLKQAPIAPEALGSIDTFRFEERALLTYCGELIAKGQFDQALAIIDERAGSYWLIRDVSRRSQWEACRLMAELGRECAQVQRAIGKTDPAAKSWIDRYTSKDEGWYKVDQAQHHLESWISKLDEDPPERPLALVREAYGETVRLMAEGFSKAMERAKWNVPGVMHQTKIYNEFISKTPKPMAYVLVDALRYEMGVELVDRLQNSSEVNYHHVIGALPSITPVGMAALQQGAAASFSVIERNGMLGSRIDDAFLPDVSARQKFASARTPNLEDITLDELLTASATKLSKRVSKAQVVIVRSQEIDQAGEAGSTYQARQIMDTVVDNIARAIRKLAVAGIEHAVVTADHGHLFSNVDLDHSMRIESPGGQIVELHRRCWIGRGGKTPPGCVRVTAAELGYDSDLDFIFPIGNGVFKAGGDLAYHHGGPSLQELVLPVLSVHTAIYKTEYVSVGSISITGEPDTLTNRIFRVAIHLGGDDLALFSTELVVRPLLVTSGRQVGSVGLAIDAEFDMTTGCVTIHSGKPATVVFRLADESVESLRIVIQDPATDTDLYRSPRDIPIHFTV